MKTEHGLRLSLHPYIEGVNQDPGEDDDRTDQPLPAIISERKLQPTQKLKDQNQDILKKTSLKGTRKRDGDKLTVPDSRVFR